MTDKSTTPAARPFAPSLERLRGAGLRPTRQRLALAKLLFEGKDRHVSAEALHEEAQAAGIRVSLATIYNTLHQFTAAGLMREIVVDSQRSYFDTNIADHHHFFHESSGRLQDIPAEDVRVARLPATPAGARIKRVDVVVRLEEN
jgi:Fur family iron response transcriptional regulator